MIIMDKLRRRPLRAIPREPEPMIAVSEVLALIAVVQDFGPQLSALDAKVTQLLELLGERTEGAA